MFRKKFMIALVLVLAVCLLFGEAFRRGLTADYGFRSCP